MDLVVDVHVLVHVVVIGALSVSGMLRQVLVVSLEIVPVNPQSKIRNPKSTWPS